MEYDILEVNRPILFAAATTVICLALSIIVG